MADHNRTIGSIARGPSDPVAAASAVLPPVCELNAQVSAVMSAYSCNLFSVGQLAELGYRIIFDYSRCIVQDPRTGRELGTGPRVGRMFPVDNLRLPFVAPASIAAIVAISSVPSLALWHARLGHASSSRVQTIGF